MKMKSKMRTAWTCDGRKFDFRNIVVIRFLRYVLERKVIKCYHKDAYFG